MRAHPFAVVVAVVVSLLGWEAQACSCEAGLMGRPLVNQMFNEAVAVVRGRVVALAPLEGKQTGMFSERITVEVTHVWKGLPIAFLDVAIPHGGSAGCGFEDLLGREFLIFAQPLVSDDPSPVLLSAHSCNGTREIVEGKESVWIEYLADQPGFSLVRATPDPEVAAVETTACSSTLSSARAPLLRLQRVGPRPGSCASCSSTGLGLGVLPLLALMRLLRRRRA